MKSVSTEKKMCKGNGRKEGREGELKKGKNKNALEEEEKLAAFQV